MTTSFREKIAVNIKAALKDIKKVKFVSREMFDIDELSDAQLPAILIQTGNELKSDSTMGYNRTGVIEYVLTGFVKGKYLDTARNNLADMIEEKLYEDITRGGYAFDTILTEVNTDEGVLFPLGAIQIIVRVSYDHEAGQLSKP